MAELNFNSVELPHVLSVDVTETANIDSRKKNEGLPVRKYLGHLGLVIRVSGWAEDDSTLDPVRTLKDNQDHTLILPTGDTLTARMTSFTPSNAAEDADEVPYSAEFRQTEAGA